MKSLLDILSDESKKVSEINILTSYIDHYSSEIKRAQSANTTDEEYRKKVIDEYIAKREPFIEERNRLMRDHEEICNDLSLYFKRLFDR